jgi:hypothetical protein
VLGRDEWVRDLSWAPDSHSTLLVTERPLAGYPAGTSLVRLRQVPLEGRSRENCATGWHDSAAVMAVARSRGELRITTPNI